MISLKLLSKSICLLLKFSTSTLVELHLCSYHIKSLPISGKNIFCAYPFQKKIRTLFHFSINSFVEVTLAVTLLDKYKTYPCICPFAFVILYFSSNLFQMIIKQTINNKVMDDINSIFLLIILLS